MNCEKRRPRAGLVSSALVVAVLCVMLASQFGLAARASARRQEVVANGPTGQALAKNEPASVQVWLPFLIETYEPNDNLSQAYGPLVWDREYRSYMPTEQDSNDFFYIITDSDQLGTWIEVELSVPPNVDLDLWVYDKDRNLITGSASTGQGVDEHTSFKAESADRYYIRVYRFSGWNADEPYTLRVR